MTWALGGRREAVTRTLGGRREAAAAADSGALGCKSGKAARSVQQLQHQHQHELKGYREVGLGVCGVR